MSNLEQMIFCWNCKEINRKGDKKCVACGKDLTEMDKFTLLESLRRVVEVCRHCPDLVRSRTLYEYGKPTFGYGNINSGIIFIGQCPGMHGCGRTGIPFKGDKSGGLYRETIKAMGLDPEEVWTTNLVRCCPEDNRNPTKTEINNCSFWLEKELNILKPKLIVALGRMAANFFGVNERLQTAQLPWNKYYWNGIPVYIAYHPAYILRMGGASEESKWLEQYRHRFIYIKKRFDELNKRGVA